MSRRPKSRYPKHVGPERYPIFGRRRRLLGRTGLVAEPPQGRDSVSSRGQSETMALHGAYVSRETYGRG